MGNSFVPRAWFGGVSCFDALLVRVLLPRISQVGLVLGVSRTCSGFGRFLCDAYVYLPILARDFVNTRFFLTGGGGYQILRGLYYTAHFCCGCENCFQLF